MEDSKKITIKICTRPCGTLFFRLFGIKHFFIMDEYNNVYEFPRYFGGTVKLTRWYLENNPSAIKFKEIKVNRKLFYKVIRIERRITKTRRYNLLKYNCYTYVNSILAKLSKF